MCVCDTHTHTHTHTHSHTYTHSHTHTTLKDMHVHTALLARRDARWKEPLWAWL